MTPLAGSEMSTNLMPRFSLNSFVSESWMCIPRSLDSTFVSLLIGIKTLSLSSIMKAQISHSQ